MNESKNSRTDPEIEIREMEIDDLGKVFHLGEKLFTSEVYPTLYRTWDEYEVAGLFLEEPEVCLVAEAGGRIIGFALGSTITKPRSAWKYGHLVWLGVAPGHHRKGVAERLFDEFKQIMKDQGVRMLIVDTEADNDAALRFFEKMGFNNKEEHIYYYLNLAGKKTRKRK